VEHAKAGPEDILCRITVHNRSSQDAGLYLLPTLWFRNTWSWGDGDPKPRLARVDTADPVVRADHHQLGVFYLYRYYGNDLRVECPTGSGTMMTLFEVAEELSRRLASTFLRDDDGRRPVYGGTGLFQEDPHWRDLILF
jgi:hypothetical protein